MRATNGKEQAQEQATSATTVSRVENIGRLGRGSARAPAAAPSHGFSIADSPRMVAQRRLIKALFGATAQLTKTEHDVGDLHYGVSDPRYDGFDDMQEAAKDSKVLGPENPVTVDQLNDEAKITDKLKGADTTKGYFEAMTMITSYTLPSSPVKWQRWLGFLNGKQTNLKLDNLVTQIQSTTPPSSPSKDKLNKNGGAPTGSLTEIGKRDAIVTAYSAQQNTTVDPQYHKLVNDWIWDAFFRRTSKLGIQFTVNEGKVVHFNVHAPGNSAKGRPDSTVNAAAELNSPGRQPITHSEIRYVNRNALIGTANMDVYSHTSEVNKPRTGDEGKMPNYLANRSGTP